MAVYDPKVPGSRVIDISAEVKKALGKDYEAPEVEYRFSNGREFKRSPRDFGCYETSPDFLSGR